MRKIAFSRLVPLLVVREAARAIDFDVEALGAREVVRYFDRAKETVSHADLAIGDVVFSVAEEARSWNSDAPHRRAVARGDSTAQGRVVTSCAAVEDGATVGDNILVRQEPLGTSRVQGDRTMSARKLTPPVLKERIVAILGELESLIQDVEETVPEDDAPDTERLLEARYSVGPSTGLSAAAVALEGLVDDDELLAKALEPADVQRARRDKPAPPDAAAFAAAARKGVADKPKG